MMPETTSRFRRHEFLARPQARQDHIFRIEEGWACRQRVLPDGRRQITDLFLPGDFCEPQWLLDRCAEQAVVALTPLRATELMLGPAGIDHLPEGPTVRSLLQATVTTINRQTRRIVSLGCGSATGRVCDLLLELFARMRVQGRLVGDRCPLPLTQTDIAETLGLTPVHVNRVLMRLRRARAIDLAGRWLRIRSPERLREIAVGGDAC
jgi:CRP-like cAMP-binding protein